MRIRLARPEERGALEALQRRASLALDEYRAQLEAHPEAIELPANQIVQGDVLVAEDGGKIAGFAVLLSGQACAELDGLFVEPGRWGHGVGAKLVDAAVAEAHRRGLTRITVVAGPGARGFYERCGFTVDGAAKTRFGPALRMSR